MYYEVITGVQTYHFEPNCFIDVSATAKQKRSAVYAHVCQNLSRFYPITRRWSRNEDPKRGVHGLNLLKSFARNCLNRACPSNVEAAILSLIDRP